MYIKLEKPIIQEMVTRHCDDAAFIWLQRSREVVSATAYPSDIARRDQLLQAHIRGLHAAGETGWRTSFTALEQFPEAGEMFVATSLALASSAWKAKVAELIAIVDKAPSSAEGFISAAAWCRKAQGIALLEHLLTRTDTTALWLALAGCVLRRLNPGPQLSTALEHEHSMVSLWAIRAIGTLGLDQSCDPLLAFLEAADKEHQFQAAWSLALLGQRGAALDALIAIALDPNSPNQRKALAVAIRAMPYADACKLIEKMSQNQATHRAAVLACGWLGAAETVPWLIGKMTDPAVAEEAGVAFSWLTGLNLEQENLTSPVLVADQEESEPLLLPRPDQAKVHQWWRTNGKYFDRQSRYLKGRALNQKNLLYALDNASQAIRHGAALDLVLRQHHRYLRNPSANALQSANSKP